MVIKILFSCSTLSHFEDNLCTCMRTLELMHPKHLTSSVMAFVFILSDPESSCIPMPPHFCSVICISNKNAHVPCVLLQLLCGVNLCYPGWSGSQMNRDFSRSSSCSKTHSRPTLSHRELSSKYPSALSSKRLPH